MSIFRRMLKRFHRGDRGAVLLVVVVIGMLMLVLVATALTVAVAGLKKADNDQDWNGAIEAAYAGVEEYQSRLATDNSYYTYGNPAAPFSSLPMSASTVVLPAAIATNAAFGVGASGTWANVPGSSPIATFRYEVDNSKYSTNGTIRVRVTGRVGTVTRSIVADLKQSGFIDYVWFTDYEVMDPDISGRTDCAVHKWEVPSRSGCDIQFGANDVLQGPVHSNDTLAICGATFGGKVTSSSTSSPIMTTPSGCSAATYPGGATRPVYSPELTMPATNAELKKETRNDLPSEVPIPGCLYTGPTVISFTSDGKMNVRSPWTLKTNLSQTSGIVSASPAKCGTPGSGTGGLGSATGATINVLPANVIYVQNVPTVTTDPNYRSSNPTGFTCITGTNPGWTSSSNQFPIANEAKPDSATTSRPAYGCKNGDLFVSGTLNGAMTIGAENYVYVTGDIRYAGTDDILGLVGNGAVWVWNPMTAYDSPLLASNRTINAAIFSVGHTFQVQNYGSGSSRGTLTVKGSIVQTFRGPVGTTGGSGYLKNYVYDSRLAYLAPPKFLSPVSSAYGITQYANVPAAFVASGATAP